MEVSSEKKSRKSAAFARKEIAKGEEARKVSKHGKKKAAKDLLEARRCQN